MYNTNNSNILRKQPHLLKWVFLCFWPWHYQEAPAETESPTTWPISFTTTTMFHLPNCLFWLDTDFLLCSTNNPLLGFVDSSEILHNLANSLGLLRLIWRPKAFCCCYGFLYRFLTFQWWPNSWKIKSYYYSGEFQSYKSYVLMHDFSSPRSVENKTETKRNIIAEQIQFIKINGVNSIWPNWLNLAFDSFRWNYKRKNRNLLTLKKNL